MNIYFNRGIPLNLETKKAIKDAGIIMLKRRLHQKVPGIVINHGNRDCDIKAPIVINPPKYIHQTSVYESARRLKDFMPDVRFRLSDVDYLPFIAKNDGFKGRGKVVVTDKKEWNTREKNARLARYSIYQKFIEPPSLEYRIVMFDNKPVVVFKKEIANKWDPSCDKVYHLCAEGQALKPLPERILNIAVEASKQFDLELLGLDLIIPGERIRKDSPGYIIEANSAPGMGLMFTLPRLKSMILEKYDR